ncbi:MAG: hypothetical protein D6763_04065 [Alphaproteobacteria bacterium]|nr:MAG: hypothetical protein D6763_04065 [Alphaproteobacteria bacterium]
MLTVGDELTPIEINEVLAEDVLEWSSILNDPNPIHLDPKASAANGLGNRTVNQGPANLGAIINLIVSNFPDGMIEVIDVKFVGNVFSGDSLRASGRITDVNRDRDCSRIRCAVELRAGNRIALTGQVEIRLPGQPQSYRCSDE